jgi:glutamate-5-semialdehyde dehydrogenase
MTIRQIAERAKAAAHALTKLDQVARTNLLEQMHDALRDARADVLRANTLDMERAAQSKLAKPMLDRLSLDEKRFDAMLQGLRDVTAQKDPLGEVIEKRQTPNGLSLSKVRVPIGVVGMIYESRPNVTCEAASLCFKSGNAVILKGGSEALHTNRTICEAMQRPLKAHKLEGAISFIDSTDRESVKELVQLEGLVDLAIPRGGEGLIRAVMEWARVPVIKHSKGVCHTFVDKDADLEKALAICENAKCQRPSVCNAMETLLVHEHVAAQFLPKCVARLSAKGVEFRGDQTARKISPSINVATDDDWSAEYLDLILAVKVVRNVDEAIAHINKFGSNHSDAILSNSPESQRRFLNEVDSAVVYVNASTRFTDGAEFGMGAEIGISTDKLHVRGPMGATELTTYKWQVIGNGQIRG